MICILLCHLVIKQLKKKVKINWYYIQNRAVFCYTNRYISVGNRESKILKVSLGPAVFVFIRVFSKWGLLATKLMVFFNVHIQWEYYYQISSSLLHITRFFFLHRTCGKLSFNSFFFFFFFLTIFFLLTSLSQKGYIFLDIGNFHSVATTLDITLKTC